MICFIFYNKVGFYSNFLIFEKNIGKREKRWEKNKDEKK